MTIEHFIEKISSQPLEPTFKKQLLTLAQSVRNNPDAMEILKQFLTTTIAQRSSSLAEALLHNEQTRDAIVPILEEFTENN
jgi:hypothetical protein